MVNFYPRNLIEDGGFLGVLLVFPIKLDKKQSRHPGRQSLEEGGCGNESKDQIIVEKGNQRTAGFPSSLTLLSRIM